MIYLKIIFPIFLLSWINPNNKSSPNKTSMTIEFELFRDSLKNTKDMDYDEYITTKMPAIIKRNFTCDTILHDVYRPLHYGYKGESSYVEAYDLEGNEINICGEVDYQYIFDPESWPFENVENGDSFLDTIDLHFLYKFEEKGIYQLRFIDELEGTRIYSNWDTLKVH